MAFFSAPPTFDTDVYSAELQAMSDDELYRECSYRIWSGAWDNHLGLWSQDAKDTDARCGLLIDESNRRGSGIYDRAHRDLVREHSR